MNDLEKAIKSIELSMKDESAPFTIELGENKFYCVIDKALEIALSVMREKLEWERTNGWISRNDDVPKMKTGDVLATNGDIILTAPASTVRNNIHITHWMPLPEPPKPSGGETD